MDQLDAREGFADERRDMARGGFRRNARRFLVAILLLPVVLIVGAVLLLQFDSVSTNLVNRFVARLDLWPDATLTARRASIDGLGRLVLYDLHLRRADGVTMATVDTASIHFRALALFRRAFIVPSARLAGAHIIMRQQADSAWDLLDPFTDEPGEPGRPIEVRLDDVHVERAQIEAYYLASKDSVLRVDSLSLHLGHLHTLGSLSVDIDTLAALLYPPSRPLTPARFSISGSLDRNVVTARGVSIRSDSSNVFAHGAMLLPGGQSRDIRDIDFRLTAQPLDFRDVGALVPGFDVPGSLRLNAHVTGTSSTMEFEADGRTFDGATLQARGRIEREAGDSIRYIIDAQVRDMDPQLWAANAPPVERVDADARISLVGASPQTLDGTVSARIGRTQLQDLVILPSSVVARFDRGVAHVTATGGVAPWAEFRGTGTVRPFDDRISASFSMTLRQLTDTVLGGVRIADVVAVANGTWRNDRLDARVIASEGIVGSAQLDTLNAQVGYHRASVSFNGNIGTDAGNMIVAARGDQIDRIPVWTVSRATLDGVNLARFDTAYPPTDLNGTVSGEARGRDIHTMTADARVQMTESRIRDERIREASFVAGLNDGRIDVRGGVTAVRGRATLVGWIEPFEQARPFQLDAVRFSDVVFDTGPGEQRVAIAGFLMARGAIPADTFPSISGSLEVDPTRIRNAQFLGGRANFSLVADSAEATGAFRTAGGSVSFNAGGRLARSDSGIRIARGRAEGFVSLPDLEEFVGDDSTDARLDARFIVEADGRDPSSMAWMTRVNATASYGTARLDTLTLDARVAAGILHLDTLVLRSNVARGDGGGVVAINDRAAPLDTGGLHVRIDADSAYAFDDLLPLRHFSLRGGTLLLDAVNEGGAVAASTSVRLRGLISPGAWADSVELNGTARVRNLKVEALAAEFGGNDLGYRTTELAAIRGTVDYDRTTAKFDVTVTGDDSHSLRLAGTAIPRERAITFANMDVAVDSATWALTAPSTITYGPRIAITDFSLVNGTRRIAVNGVLDRRGTQDLTVTLDSVPVRGFAEFAGFDGLNGMLHGTIAVAGPAARVAVATDMNFVLLGTRGRLAMAPNEEDGRMGVDAILTDSLGKTMHVNGTIPVAISLAESDTTLFSAAGPISLRARSDSFSVGWLAPLVRPVGITRMGGALRTDIEIVGSFAEPAMAGDAALLGGHISYPRHGVSYGSVQGEFVLAGDRMRVTSLTAHAEGTARIEGDIVMETVADPQLNLRAEFSAFRAATNEWTRLGVTGSATITGALLAPEIEGRLRLVDTDMYADPVGKTSGGSAVELTPADLRMLEYYFGYDVTRIRQQTTSLIDPWTMNIQLTVGPDTWLRRRRSPELRVQLEGSLDVRKAAGDSIQLFGTISVLPERSYFEQFGRRFQVSSGSVAFNGPMMGWEADFNARYVVPSTQDPGAPEVVITLGVTGTLDDLDLTLGGEPAMETADVLSYLATGRPAASAAEFGGSDLANMGATVAASQLTSVLEESAARGVGLDVVEIRHDGLRGATVVAGRYVSPRLFVGFEQPLTLRDDDEDERRQADRQTEVQLEYRMYRWLLASLEGGQSNFRFLFRVRRAF